MHLGTLQLRSKHIMRKMLPSEGGGTFAAPNFFGCYQYSTTWKKPLYFSPKEKYTYSKASGEFLKFFRGKWKSDMAPSWGAAASPSMYCQCRQAEQEHESPWATRGVAPATLLHSKTSTRRTDTCLQLDFAPFQRGECMQVKQYTKKYGI